MFQFAFTETASDIRDAYEAHRTARFRMRRWARVCVGLYGLMFFAFLPFAAVERLDVRWWQVLLWLTVGTTVTWNFVGKPALIRRGFRQVPDHDVAVQVSDTGVIVRVGNAETSQRYWGEFVGMLSARKGVGLGFRDGMIYWLPRRVFANQAAREELEAVLKSKLPEDAPAPAN